jgi:hypothetical protein
MAPKDKKGGKKGLATGAPIQDPRFSHVHRDPRFVKPQKKDSKVTVDSRFSSMLKGKEFSSARTYLNQLVTFDPWECPKNDSVRFVVMINVLTIHFIPSHFYQL